MCIRLLATLSEVEKYFDRNKFYSWKMSSWHLCSWFSFFFFNFVYKIGSLSCKVLIRQYFKQLMHHDSFRKRNISIHSHFHPGAGSCFLPCSRLLSIKESIKMSPVISPNIIFHHFKLKIWNKVGILRFYWLNYI